MSQQTPLEAYVYAYKTFFCLTKESEERAKQELGVSDADIAAHKEEMRQRLKGPIPPGFKEMMENYDVFLRDRERL